MLRQRRRLQRDQPGRSPRPAATGRSTTSARAVPSWSVTANPGCLLQLRSGLARDPSSSTVEVKHLVELLDVAYFGVTGSKSIAADLRRVVQDSRVLDAPAELRTFAYDASFLTQLRPRPPDAVVIARSTADVSAVLRYASAHEVPVVPRGAASGQAAGAVARHGGIVLALNALNRVLEIDVGQHAGLLRAGRGARRPECPARPVSADLSARPGLEPHGHRGRHGVRRMPMACAPSSTDPPAPGCSAWRWCWPAAR